MKNERASAAALAEPAARRGRSEPEPLAKRRTLGAPNAPQRPAHGAAATGTARAAGGSNFRPY